MKIDVDKLIAGRVERFTKSGDWTATTTNETLAHWARETPDRVALVDARRKLTYRAYYDSARALAARFVAAGITRDDVVAIQLYNCVEFAVAVSAAMLAGIPFCQFHHGFRRKEGALVLGFTQAKAVLVPDRFGGFDYPTMIAEMRAELPHLQHVGIVGDTLAEGAFDVRAAMSQRLDPRSEAELAQRRPHGNDVCRIAFTSGTTGDPKAVVHTHNTSGCTARSSVRDQHADERSAYLLFLPVGLNWGIGCTLQALIAGAKIVFMEKFGPEAALRTIETERITHVATAPTSLVSLIDAPTLAQYDVSSLEVIITGGASCPVEVLRRAQERLPAKITEMYGMLESGVQARTRLDDDPLAVAGTVGRPAREVLVKVLHEDESETAVGEAGEIVCFGPSVMLGYYNNPAANAQAFTSHGWFRTGDIGFFDAAGRLTISGRKKEMIVRGGANVYPREIEEVLFSHPAIADAAVVGIPHATLGETAVACVVTRPGAALTFAAMSDFLAPKIAKYKLPETLVLLDALPRTPTGKVRKLELARLVMNHTLVARRESAEPEQRWT